jgi:hypothetical protein
MPVACCPPIARLRCDAPQCQDEFALRIAGEQFCFPHAVARANAGRVAAGLPPIAFDSDGSAHPQQ